MMEGDMEEIALEVDVSQWVAMDHTEEDSMDNVKVMDSPTVAPTQRPAPPAAATTTTTAAAAATSSSSVWGFWSSLGDNIGEKFTALGSAIEEKTGIAEKVVGTIDSIDGKLAISATVDDLAQKVNTVLEKPAPPPGFKKIGQCDDGDPYKNPLIDDDELQYL
jgi:hypothetical protein